jgi:hypothetical protein
LKVVWQYLVGRSTNAEMHLEFDGKEVFEAPRARPGSGVNKPYFNGGISVKSNADPKK